MTDLPPDGERIAALETEMKSLRAVLDRLEAGQTEIAKDVAGVRERLSGAHGAARAVLAILGVGATLMAISKFFGGNLGGGH